jgi:hypothetical protein
MKALLIGLGEIGTAVKNYYSQFHDIEGYDPKYSNELPHKTEYDILLVTIPYSNSFVDTVNEYKSNYSIGDVIVFSTVPVGTTSKIDGAVHSPVEGRHPNLTESIKLFPRYIGGNSSIAGLFFMASHKHNNLHFIEEPDHTEFLKLQSTSNYGLMIEYARYCKTVCDELGLDYGFIKQFNSDYNELYDNLGLGDRIKRYILEAPTGDIKGHCIVPNAKLLDKQFPSIFLKEIYRDKEMG